MQLILTYLALYAVSLVLAHFSGESPESALIYAFTATWLVHELNKDKNK